MADSSTADALNDGRSDYNKIYQPLTYRGKGSLAGLSKKAVFNTKEVASVRFWTQHLNGTRLFFDIDVAPFKAREVKIAGCKDAACTARKCSEGGGSLNIDDGLCYILLTVSEVCVKVAFDGTAWRLSNR